MVPPQKLIELFRIYGTFLLLSLVAQKQATIPSEVSMDARTTGDSVRRHPGKRTRRSRYNLAGWQQ
jgi:hypothetical protein